MTKKTLLIVAFRPLENAPRVQKQIDILGNDFDITELAFSPSLTSTNFKKIEFPDKGTWFQKLQWIWGTLQGDLTHFVNRAIVTDDKELLDKKFDLVIVHDIYPCPLAFRYAKGAPVLIDLHEYLPEVNAQSFAWRIRYQRGIKKLCHQYLHRAAATLAPSEEAAELYRKNFGIRPVVNYNAPLYQNLSPTPVKKDEIHLVHHGIAIERRNIHLLLDLVEKLDIRYHLHLYLVGSGDYLNMIQKRSKNMPRVHLHPPVPLKDIAKTINKYDIGIHLLAPCNKNHDIAIGNKFFEFIQARLAVITWPTTAMRRMINTYKIGIVSQKDSLEEIVEILNKIDYRDIYKFKLESNHVAHVLTAEKSMETIQQTVKKILQ